jgi:hypothetical protein
LQLLYPNLETDAEGYVYLPVYDTVYRATSMTYPDGHGARYPSLGWFKAASRIGVLPQVVVTPKSGGRPPERNR